MGSAKRELDPQENIELGKLGGRLVRGGMLLGIVGLLASVVWGATIGDGFRRFFHSYLTAFVYVLSFGLGALFFVILQHLVNARWSVVVRRIAEGMTQAFPLLLVLGLGFVIPMLAGYDNLYVWSDKALSHGTVADLTALQLAKIQNLDVHQHAMHAKEGYLSTPFFVARFVVYFLIWIGLARWFFKRSTEQDETGEEGLTRKMSVASAPAMIVFAFSLCFAAFDFTMSLDPAWFSTIWGVYYFAGCAISIFALLSLSGLFLRKTGRLRKTITVEHYHDLGKLMFAFIFFWGYIAFSQFMLYWYANIPEEIVWFQHRWLSDWKLVTLIILFGHLIIPFVGVMSRHAKRRTAILALWATWMLVMHWIDIYWQVIPNFAPNSHHIAFHPMDVLVTVGMVGLFVAATARALSKVKLVPTKDPRLSDSLKFENI